MSEPTVQPWNMLTPTAVPAPPPAPQPDDIWPLRGGEAWVYYGAGHSEVVNPVIFSDGFNSGRSDMDMLWHGMERGDFPFISRMRERGNDLILLGYTERSASILANAETATECIDKAANAPGRRAGLAVGGFSMGGLVTRYALAKMEHEDIEHRTEVYFSYDSPHRGAWIPIGLQALAHFLRPLTDAMSKQINSDAARQLLVHHIDEYDAQVREDPMRGEFLDALREVGGWPRKLRKIGLANGAGHGVGNGVPPGVEALKCTGALHPLKGTTLYTQASGDDRLVAKLKSVLIADPIEVRTDGMLEFDGAPGGTLDSFEIARQELVKYGATQADHPSICFVPTVSAVAIRDLDTAANLYADVSALPPEDSELDEFICSSDNLLHSKMTEELGTWLLERLPK
ncbi:esterase/lipase family protein [Wenjunlia tyrosinilytica]|uniref:DUF676 domain-containing protein n=1 Tax=Wenjunlia tyrosinilytica TaxID=1544741 RepID=A0A918DZK3_9ACTN|nr:hypothetical protein [Wenjunlia tyrosinilytica]GGO94185.1 hypothetical protein GCM10012280_48440 [Wenjunlia tyrosinilytica]